MDSKPAEGYESFEDLKVRLDEIVEAVSDDDLPLDEALELYEEAVALGLRASDLLEEGIEARRAAEAEAESAAAAPDAAPNDSPVTVSTPSAPAAAGSADPAPAEDASASADGAAVAQDVALGN